MLEQTKREILKTIKNNEEKIVLAKALDKAIFSYKTNNCTFTDFLDLYKINFLKNIIAQNININFKVYGGYLEAERGIIAFYPEFMEINDSDYPLAILEIAINTTYSNSITHKDYLGSILGLGLKRNKIGDIIVLDNKALCFVSDDISDYIIYNLSKVKNSKVTVTQKNSLENYNLKQHFDEITFTIQSIRVDTLISKSFNVSRAVSSKMISSKKLFVNWKMIDNCSYVPKENDIITLRGYGRIQLKNIGNLTKKGKIKLTILKYI